MPQSIKMICSYIIDVRNTQNFIYDFRWLSVPYRDHGGKSKLEENEFELHEIGIPPKIKPELRKLTTINPRDPAVVRSSPKMVKR